MAAHGGGLAWCNDAVSTALGIDVGTTNAKACLIDEAGAVLATASRNIAAPSRHRPETGTASGTESGTADGHDDGRAELDAEAQWQAVVATVRECVDNAGRDHGDTGPVVAVGVDSQYSSIVPVAADGTPVAPMRLWYDRRGTDRSFAVLAHDDAFLGFIDRHGIPPVGGGLSLGHILHLQHDCPDVHAATAAYLEPMDYVNARLTGRIAANQGTQFTAQLVDNRSLGQTAYDDVLLGWSGVDPSRLPPLLPLDELLGTVRPEVAADLGIDPGAVVVAGLNDTQASTIATGVYTEGTGGLSIGTTAVLTDTVDGKRVDLDHEVLSCPSPFDDTYLLFAENGLGGRPLEHVLTEVVETGGFDTLDEVLASVPPGSRGVLFLPWLHGSMAPANDTAMRGGFVNMGLDTGRPELVRATCEGVAHNLAWLLPHAEALTEQRIERISFVGGAARSDGWARIVADVLGRPVSVADQPTIAIARATALLALHRTGRLTRDELLASASTARATFDPDPDAHAVHAARQPHFEAAFDALRPIVHALA